MMVISFPFSLYSQLLSTSKTRRPFLMKCSEKKGTFNFFSLQPKVHKIFKSAMRPKLPTTVTFAAPSKKVGNPRGDSMHGGAPVRPVPRGSTHWKSGPGHGMSWEDVWCLIPHPNNIDKF